jgi:hypothetical protein
MSSTQTSWIFQPYEPRPGISNGNITRLFNTGDSTPPAAFARLIDRDDDAATSAVIYGREGIANCVDASIAAQRKSGTLGLDFYFEEFSGREAENYWNLLSLDELAERATSSDLDRGKDLGLLPEDCLTRGRKKPLRLLTVIERGGGGMPGSLQDPDSVLTRALMAVGEPNMTIGAAGSYGYGKAAVAQASRPRVLLVYTCFPRDKSTDGVTRRLMGISYWGTHSHAGTKYTGWGLFGPGHAGGMSALEDEAADEFAELLDLPVRSPDVEEDLGTTFVIVDPMFGAEELAAAVEIFWWPLLLGTRDVKLDLKIHDEAGDTHTVTVDEDHPELGQFVRAFTAAERSRTSKTDVIAEREVVLNRVAGITSLEVKSDSSPIDRSLVAKMRSPLMVVSYEKQKNTNPPLVGVFVSHDSTNENLRRVEPPEHDKWQKKRVGGLRPTSRDIAISKKVTEEINEAVNALRAPEPKAVTDLTDFSRFFPAIDGGVAKPKPPRPKGQRQQRLVHVNLVHHLDNLLATVDRPQREHLPDGTLRARAFVRFWLDKDRAARVNRTSLDATISVGARIYEEGSSGEWHPASVKQRKVGEEKTFRRTSKAGAMPTTFEGRFSIGDSVCFEIETDPYDADWTIELIFDCDPWDVVQPRKAVEVGAADADGGE